MGSHGDVWDVRIGHYELLVRGRYEAISIINDLLIGLWFVVGSFLFFFDFTATDGKWAFLLGSAQLLIRPVIRLHRRITLSRIGAMSHFGGLQDL